jgi:hypothetical protein
MPKPWEYDWSGGGDPSGLNLLPIVPFLGGQRPPMLGDDGQSIVPPMPAGGSYPMPPVDPFALQRTGPLPAAAPDALATAGPDTAPALAADAFAAPAMAPPQPFGLDAAAWQPSPPPGLGENPFLQPELQQPSAIASFPAQGVMPRPRGAGGQSLLQPAVYDGWSGTSAPSPNLTSPSQENFAPPHLTLAQARSTLEHGVPDMMPRNALIQGTSPRPADRNGDRQQIEQRQPVPGLIMPVPFDARGAVNRPLWFYRIEHQGETSSQKQVSKKGAVSVMQIMPDTAPEAAHLAKLPLNWKKLRTDPDYARTLGYAYLDSLLKRFDGNVVLATAAYNGGKGNVAKWIKQYGDPRKGDISDYEFAQNIPFGQTKEYVGRVVYGETWAEQDQRRKQERELERQRRQTQPRRRSPPLIGQT